MDCSRSWADRGSSCSWRGGGGGRLACYGEPPGLCLPSVVLIGYEVNIEGRGSGSPMMSIVDLLGGVGTLYVVRCFMKVER